MASAPAEAKVNPENLQGEFVGGGYVYYGARLWNTGADQLQPNLTYLDIERARRDDEVSSSVEFLIDSIFSDGGQVVPSVHTDDPDFEKAQEIADFCQKAIDAASKTFLFTLRQQFRAAFYHGTKVGEIVLRYANDSRFDNKLVLDRVNLKPLNATAFLTDQFENVLGLIAARDERKTLGTTAKDLGANEAIEREKFQILSFEHDDNDPRGITQIKATIESFCDKVITRLQYKEWRKKNAVTQKFFTTAENAKDIPVRDPNTGQPVLVNGVPKVTTPQKALLDAAENMENNSVLVGPHGTTCQLLQVTGNGEQFEKSIKLNNGAIRKSILGDALATGSADKDSRAARESSMHAVDLRVKSFKFLTCIAVKRDLLTVLTKVNYPENLWHLVPDFSLGDTERRDWAIDITAAAGVGYSVAKKHLPELDKQFGLDPRDDDDASMQETAPVDQNANADKQANQNDPNNKNSYGGGKNEQ